MDFVILGAGVGGALLALLLGRQGHRVLVVEPHRERCTRGADILKARGMRVLARHGLLDPLLGAGALPRRFIDFHHDGTLLLSYDFAEHTAIGRFLAVPYAKTVGAVMNACADLPNVEVRYGRRISALEIDDSRVNGVGLDDGSWLRVERALVDSGGSASPLGHFVGSAREVLSYDHVLRMTTVAATPSVLTRNRLYFDSDGWMAYFYPVSTTRARVFVGLPHEQDSAVFAERSVELRERLALFVTSNDDALGLLDAERFTPAPVAAFTSKPYHRDNVVLLGGAAFASHPMTGQGMSYTLEDAAGLAEILGSARDDGEMERMLNRRYEESSTPHAELVAYGDALARSYHDPTAYLLAHQALLHGGDG